MWGKMFLTVSEIQALTGRTRHSAQVRWLRDHGYRHTVNALGAPVVAIAEANRKLVGGTKTTQQPNWEALNGKAS
jgi:hypothetical protein